MIKTQMGFWLPVMIVFVVVVSLIHHYLKGKRYRTWIYRIMFFAYCLSVLWVVLLSRHVQETRCVFGIPFSSYMKAHRDYIINCSVIPEESTAIIEKIRALFYSYNWIVLNVLLFVPYGFIVTKAFPANNKLLLLSYGLIGSTIIELMQLIFKLGCFDVDDIIHNAIGICIGYALALMLLRENMNGTTARENKNVNKSK